MNVNSTALVGYGYGGLIPVQQAINSSRQRMNTESIDAVVQARQRGGGQRESAEKVLQGELIDRGRQQQSATTSDFLRGNVYDAEQFLRSQQHRVKRDPEQASSFSRSALNAYQSNRQDTIDPNAKRGNGVDYFI